MKSLFQIWVLDTPTLVGQLRHPSSPTADVNRRCCQQHYKQLRRTFAQWWHTSATGAQVTCVVDVKQNLRDGTVATVFRCVKQTHVTAGLFEMIVGVWTTCTQYTWDRSMCIFLFNRKTLQVFVTYPTGALYVHPLWYESEPLLKKIQGYSKWLSGF